MRSFTVLWFFAIIAFMFYASSTGKVSKPAPALEDMGTIMDEPTTFDKRFGKWEKIGDVEIPALCHCELDEDD